MRSPSVDDSDASTPSKIMMLQFLFLSLLLWLFIEYGVQYYDTLSEALSIVDEEAAVNSLILVHSGVYRDESLFMDYSATVLGAGTYWHVLM